MIRSTLSVTKHTPSARALVAAEHPLGAEVGAGILARGGNAVDAAVATAFAMTVVEPFMSSVAGGGTMLVHLARRGETIALDFNVQAPAACHESCYELGEGVAQALFPWRPWWGTPTTWARSRWRSRARWPGSVWPSSGTARWTWPT